jgi:hypothetical protein
VEQPLFPTPKLFTDRLKLLERGNAVGATSTQAIAPEETLPKPSEVKKHPVRRLPPRLPIPALPPPVSGYPTPHITNEELNEYLLPLYSRNWGVSHFTENFSIKSRSGNRLTKLFQFNDFINGVYFARDVGEIAKQEDVRNYRPPKKLLASLIRNYMLAPPYNQYRREIRRSQLYHALWNIYFDSRPSRRSLGGMHNTPGRPPCHPRRRRLQAILRISSTRQGRLAWLSPSIQTRIN